MQGRSAKGQGRSHGGPNNDAIVSSGDGWNSYSAGSRWSGSTGPAGVSWDGDGWRSAVHLEHSRPKGAGRSGGRAGGYSGTSGGKGQSRGNSGKGWSGKGDDHKWGGWSGSSSDWGSSCMQQRQLTVPQQAIGLILGKGGRNIKELQNVEGIKRVWFDKSSSQLQVAGAPNAVAAVCSEVEKQVNKSLVAKDVETALTVVELGGNETGNVAMVSSAELKRLPVTLADGAPGREYFAVCIGAAFTAEERAALQPLFHGSSEGGLVRRALQSEQGRKAQGRFVLGLQNREGFSDELHDLLSAVSTRVHTRVRAEARYGVKLFAFPPAGLARGRPMPQEVFADLDLYTDLQPRFFCSLRPSAVKSIKAFLLDAGFIPVPPEQRTVLHLIDAQERQRLSITIAEQEDGSDPREGDAGKREVERIASCCNYYQVLGLQADCSDKDVRGAYYKLAKLVHPDKNSHPGAESAMKVVGMCKDALSTAQGRETYNLKPLAPPPLDMVRTGSKLKVVKCHGDQRKHLVMDIVKPGDELGARVQVRSYVDYQQDPPDLMQFLDEAWANRRDGNMFPDGDGRYRLDAVRYKTKYRFTDGDSKVIIEHVRQREFRGEAYDRWEVEVRSHELKSAMKSSEPLDQHRETELLDALHDFTTRISNLGSAMTSDAIRMLTDADFQEEVLAPLELS